MNRYRIKYKSSHKGVTHVSADSINGFQPEKDTYIFKSDGEIVAAIPKANVVSIELVKLTDGE